MSYTNISQAGTLHSEGIRTLDFYKEEISIMQKRLEEVAGKNNSFEARQGIEHFQNQFILQRNNIDELRHRINEYAQHLATDAREHMGKIDKQRLGEENVLADETAELEKLIQDLRREFNGFLSKWM